MENRLLRGAEGTSLRVELLRTDQDDPRVTRWVRFCACVGRMSPL